MLTPGWRDQIVEEARTWMNTPYAHRGRVKGVGVDCGGLIYNLYAPYLPLPPFPEGYAQDWSMHREGNELYLDFIMPFVVETAQPGIADLALFHFGRNFSHGAVVVPGGKFIHAFGRNGFGSVIESNMQFFQRHGRQVAVKYFTAKPEWLS